MVLMIIYILKSVKLLSRLLIFFSLYQWRSDGERKEPVDPGRLSSRGAFGLNFFTVIECSANN